MKIQGGEKIVGGVGVFGVYLLTSLETVLNCISAGEVCFIVASLCVPLQRSVRGVFPAPAHRAAAAKPQPGHNER